MKRICALIGALGGAQAASAQDLTITPLVDARLRYERVEQDGLPNDADAVTARFRPGIVATRARWSALVEAEATLAIADRYFDGVNGDPLRPLVLDPQNIELNCVQLSYAVPHRGSLAAGRQRIDLADQHFVGSAPFRQNDQTFDSVRLRWTAMPRVSADVTYAWSVRTVNGINGTGVRQQAISGNNVFALLGYAAPIGTLTGFAYLVDQDETALQASACRARPTACASWASARSRRTGRWPMPPLGPRNAITGATPIIIPPVTGRSKAS